MPVMLKAMASASMNPYRPSTSMGKIITLTTDFGFKTTMLSQSAVLGITPNARLVDISHEIPPQDIMAGAWVIRICLSISKKKAFIW